MNVDGDSPQCERCDDNPIQYELVSEDDTDRRLFCRECFYDQIQTINNDGVVRLSSEDGRYTATNLTDEE